MERVDHPEHYNKGIEAIDYNVNPEYMLKDILVEIEKSALDEIETNITKS